MRYLRVTRYPHDPAEQPSHDKLRAFLTQAGLADAVEWQFTTVRQGLAAIHETEQTRVEVISPRIAGYNSRGGTVTMLPMLGPRTAPCSMVETSASIDVRGDLATRASTV